MDVSVSVNMQPPLKLTDIPALSSIPDGVYAYSRAVLHYAIVFLEMCIDKSAVKVTRKPQVMIEMPCPALFNAFYESKMSFLITKDTPMPVSSEPVDYGGMVKHLEQNADTSHGSIRLSDALADTLLYLTHTRRFFLNELQADKRPLANRIPAEVKAEIRELFAYWDHWTPKARLDLAHSKDIPRFKQTATQGEIGLQAAKHDPGLICAVFFVVAHEYGHFLQTYGGDVGKEVTQNAGKLLSVFIGDAQFGTIPVLEKWQRALRCDPALFEQWREEAGSDVVSLTWFIEALHGEKDGIRQATGMLLLIQTLIEAYAIRKFGGFGSTHPVASVRYSMLIMVLANLLKHTDESFYRHVRHAAELASHWQGLFSQSVF